MSREWTRDAEIALEIWRSTENSNEQKKKKTKMSEFVVVVSSFLNCYVHDDIKRRLSAGGSH
jgi:hypothetical protein